MNKILRSHIFIVNEETLPKHLRYKFVGVSAGGKNFNIGLLADIFRVKQDDLIFFYIEGTQNKKGRFFGIFQSIDNKVYYLTDKNAKQPDLSVKLIYRKQIIPYKVFPKGALEWIVLDKLPRFSNELLWTLIYRKMKGKRGNTMLFPWETERLISLIEEENNGNYLNSNCFDFDKEIFEIISTTNNNILYLQNQINLSENDIKNSETHFQAYILQNLNITNNTFFLEIFGKNLIWIGNEVFAGSGMQKIDLLTIEKVDDTKFIFRIIEIKHPKSQTGISFAPSQLEYYINWAREDIGGHLMGAKKFNTKPILVVLTKNFGSIPKDVINNISKLNSISFGPEIYELNFNLEINKIL